MAASRFTRMRRRLVASASPAQRQLLGRAAGRLNAAGRALQAIGTADHAVEPGLSLHGLAADSLAGVQELLDAAGIEYAVIPRGTELRPLVVISASDATALERALEAWSARQQFAISVEQATTPLRRVLAGRRAPAPLSVRLRPLRQASDGVEVYTGAAAVTIQLWERVTTPEPRVDGEDFLVGTLRRRPGQRVSTLAYLEPAVWAEAQRHPRRWIAFDRPLITEVRDPIDVVYTWVDGDDPAWQRRKAEALGEEQLAAVNPTAASASRFANRDELMYSLRSLEMYASWVRHVYLVTDQQVPAWLRRDHPKLTVVDHRDIFTDPSVLPVYNSHAIESQLHHIPGLSEKYIYMNDDVFFFRAVEPDLFFTSSGLSKFFLSRAVLDAGPPSERDMPVLSAAKRNRALMQDVAGFTVTQKFKHTPHPQLRSVLEAFEAQNPELVAEVSASRVRHPDDYSIASALHHYWAYAHQKAVEGRIRYDYIDVASPDAELRLTRMLLRRSLDVVCLNDTHADPEQMEHVQKIMTDFLQAAFPLRSSFER